MKVLFASTEVDPLAKTGGLADVASSLPKALKTEGVSISIIMPFYKKHIARSGKTVEKTDLKVEVKLGEEKIRADIYKTQLDKVEVFLIQNDELFDRDNLYGTPEGDYPDNWKRFGFFCYAILEIAKQLKIDIVHLNDWQTGLVPLLKLRKYDKDLSKVKTVFTIHNLAYQGTFEKEILVKLGLGLEDYHMEGIEYYGKINFLKAGIVYSDFITTVSPTYAQEIQTPEFGYGLEGILKKRKDNLVGILNGLDYEVWNPETDKEIYVNFSVNNILDGKKENKLHLLKDTGLEGENKPLFGIVSRLVEQKGFDLFPPIMEEIAKRNINMVVLGSGDKIYQDMFMEISKRFKNIYVKIGFDPIFAKRIYSSTDFFLMPSKYEPCGLGQLICMRYGTIPLVRATGGLKDTVKDINEGGYGIVFTKYEPKELLNAIDRAIHFYKDKEKFNEAVKFVATLDFSWKSSAREYIKLYERVLNG